MAIQKYQILLANRSHRKWQHIILHQSCILKQYIFFPSTMYALCKIIHLSPILFFSWHLSHTWLFLTDPLVDKLHTNSRAHLVGPLVTFVRGSMNASNGQVQSSDVLLSGA